MGALLSLREVAVRYARGQRHVISLLEGASFEVWPGEVVCVQAPRGRGKTALMRVAAGMERPAGGSVRIVGEDVWGLPDRRRARLLARGVGWIAGAPPELDLPALDHIATPLLVAFGKRNAYKRAHEALELVGIHECAEQHWESLSDTERALLALARASAGEPRLLLVDDLTALLRGEESDGIGRLLATLAAEREIGVLASVSHARETLWADRIAALSGGELMMPARAPRSSVGKVLEFPGPRRPTPTGSDREPSGRQGSERDPARGVPV